MPALKDNSVDLVVTSPPYPMIAMWDDIFSSQTAQAAEGHGLAGTDDGHGLAGPDDGHASFERMHSLLDKVWAECVRVLRPGGFICINIGDAARKVGDEFALYPSHSRIISAMTALGMSCLPMIHWFKPTNAPNKFMGSGMYPSGAYVTLEHEYILIFRKGGRRVFSESGMALRRRSAFFWEERNLWFSDRWDLKGVNQSLPGELSRPRSGAFPFELPHRLINMYSLQGETILDPFVGTGTTLAAAVLNGRACIGYELDSALKGEICGRLDKMVEGAEDFIESRLENHRKFIAERTIKKGPPAYINEVYDFPVMTKQETAICLPELNGLEYQLVSDKTIGVSANYALQD